MSIARIHQVSGNDKLEVRLPAIVKEVKLIRTKAGQTMAFALVEDGTGSIECIFFPAVYEKCKSDIIEGANLFIEGIVNLVESPRKIFPDFVKREVRVD